MEHLLIRVTDLAIVAPYVLRVVFEDGNEQTVDFEPVLYGHYYRPLRDVEFFNQVRLDPEVRTLVWPNDADFERIAMLIFDRERSEVGMVRRAFRLTRRRWSSNSRGGGNGCA